MHNKKRLGDLLIEAGIISNDQLIQALNEQKSSGKKIGEALVDLGFVTEQDILNVLEFMLGIPQVDLRNYPLTPDIVHTVPDSVALRHKVIAIKTDHNKVTVAMADPLNVVAIDDLRLATGLDVEPVIASEKEIERQIQRFFGLKDLDKSFEEIAVTASPLDMDTFNLDEYDESVADDAPIIKIVNSIFQQSVRDSVSDIHIEPHENEVRVRFRIDGMLRDIMTLPKKVRAALISRIKIMANMDIAEKRIPQDGRIQVKVYNRDIDLRVSTLPTIFGEKVVIRILDKGNMLFRLEQLGFSENILNRFHSVIKASFGMLLITGPTGSGKTTTLYATLNEINSPEKNIITIEDPIEYILNTINQIKVNTKAGLTFGAGLRSILRQDPDVIMVGEIRDNETADIAVRAATTGHLVLSTLHTNDAAGALTRLIDMGVEPFLVASSVVGVMSQRLVRKVCPACKTAYQLPLDSPERMFLNISDNREITLYRGKGCPQCDGTGYKGRLGIHEILPITKQQRELIHAKATADDIKRTAIEQGMTTLKEDGIAKVFAGITTVQEVMRVAYADEY